MTERLRIGFTGTRVGMTASQHARLVALLVELDPAEFHHGDCVGADEQAHEVVRRFIVPGATVIRTLDQVWGGCRIVIHPPHSQKYRANCKGDEMRFVKDYIIRNHDIVDETDVLVAAPKSPEEEMRSGTWATIRYAMRIGRRVEII